MNLPNLQSDQTFSYKNNGCLARGIPILMVTILVPVTVFVLLSYLLMAMMGENFSKNGVTELIIMLCILAYALVFLFPSVNEYNKIKVHQDGLKIQVFNFYFYWMDISWSEVISIRKSLRPDRKLNSIWLIQIKSLTIWHRFLGLQHMLRWSPVIVLTSDLENRELLLDVIREKKMDLE